MIKLAVKAGPDKLLARQRKFLQESYYKLALQRDQAMVEKTLQAAAEAGSGPVAEVG